MLGFAWLTLRQAQEALKNGRLEEAHRLLCEPDARGHKGSWELLQQLARGFIQRGERHLQHEDTPAAWNDLILAEQVGASDDAAAKLRQTLIRRELGEARKLLEAGEPGRAVEMLARLRDRAVQQAELQLLEEAGKNWLLARDLAARGEFPRALSALDHVRQLLPETPAALRQYRSEVEQSGAAFSALLGDLHEALNREDWRNVLLMSEKVLALAPQHAEARKARTLAWKTIEPATSPSPRPRDESSSPAGVTEQPAQRFLLWIDGIGGFLLCLGNRITIGQATAEAFVDVPICADVSRVHAALTRDSEGYLFEALRTSFVNDHPAEKALLRPGDRVTLGNSCCLKFGQPVPVSATARLDVASGHRLPLALDAVFLMADTLVLGPGPQAHIVMPDLAQPVVLFRNKDSLGVRCPGKLQVDGQACKDRAVLGAAAKVSGEDFSFAVETVGARLGRSHV
jgi:hypothetical protein